MASAPGYRDNEPMRECSVLTWAASGAMALTGTAGEPPAASPAGAFGLAEEVTGRLAAVTREAGAEVRTDPAELIAGRAALMGLTRNGRISAGGSSRLLRAADGWCAVTLSRSDDVAAVPAILGVLGTLGDPRGDGTGTGPEVWTALERAALAVPAAEIANAAQLLGVPGSALPGKPAARGSTGDAKWPPWSRTGLAEPSPEARLAGAVVADLSSMWAGPLCARLLGLAGARVIKVESPDRPDGARAGNQDFYDWLHAGHESAALGFRSQRDILRALLTTADIVIEASRPRALANLGLAPEEIRPKKGQVWLSITGYGRAEPDRVAFGDDAAVAGGLVGWPGGSASERDNGPADRPVFCADAIADPLTGVCGALAVAESVAQGGGHLIDLSMRSVAAAFASAPGPDHGRHEVRPDGTVYCPETGRSQDILPPRRPVPPGRAAAAPGADTEAVVSWLASVSRGPAPC
jgi:hypothetical protein